MNQRGFTLIELLLAMAIFSLGLVTITVGFIGIIKINQSGLASRSVQQNTRLNLEEIERAARGAYDLDKTLIGTDTSQLCLYNAGNKVKYYKDPVTEALMRATYPFAKDCTTTPASAVRLTSDDVKVVSFKVVEISEAQHSYEITLKLASNSASGGVCSPTDRFCSAAQFVTVANLRGVKQ